MKSRFLIACAAALSLSACAGGVGGIGGIGSYYSLIRARPVSVGNNSLEVTPPREWNKAPRLWLVDVKWVEDWTLNGPVLDSMTFISGMPGGEAIVRQRRRDDRQVPKFRANMTAPEITSMLESAYRVRSGTVDFTTLGLSPRAFLGANGFQFDFEHLDQDELRRKGRAVGAVIDGRLYLILYDAAKSHYFDAALPDFEAVARSARRK